jgi:hypothetical protein
MTVGEKIHRELAALMSSEIRTYLVGRQNSTIPCDIALPENEVSVSRKHLEITVTTSGRCYIVHVHPQNKTEVQSRDGIWAPITQDYVDFDAPLKLGGYITTARLLLALLPQQPVSGHPNSPPPLPPAVAGRTKWDPVNGSFLKR